MFLGILYQPNYIARSSNSLYDLEQMVLPLWAYTNPCIYT